MEELKVPVQKAVLVAANRTDNKVLSWLRTAHSDDLNFESLGFVPRRIVALDRRFAHALITLCKGSLRTTIDTQENTSVEAGGDPLTATQVVRLLYDSFRMATTHAPTVRSYRTPHVDLVRR